MVKNLQARLKQYMNCELPDVQACFRKGIGTRDQIANIFWIIEKARQFQKNIYFCFIDYAKAVDCVDHNKLWNILKEMGISDHLTCLMRILYSGQEATVRTIHGITDLFQIEKGVRQGCILSPCLFNLYAVYTMWNVRLEEAKGGIKIAGKNINNLRYEDNTILTAESEKELKSLLMKVKEESKNVGLKLNIQKTKIMASGSTTSWQIDGETVETVADFIFLGSKIIADMTLKDAYSLESYDQPRQHIKKQRHYFVNKVPSSQGYGFSSSHVWMWDLHYKESWALKNWCFWMMILETTLESPLDCKEIEPVHPKGNQSWVFIGRTDVESETPIL